MEPFTYSRRRPETTALYRCVEEHLEAFVAETEGGDQALPKFIRREFDAFLTCGILANGFARVHCGGCRFDRLVAFSCKRRGFCPSCGGRRMSETAAHLVDNVIPEVPMRQWVLSLPPPLRYLVAYDAGLCSAILGIFIGEVFKWRRRTAKHELALASVNEARPGAIAVLQRFGSSLNLNVHIHALVTDGVFMRTGAEAPIFRALRDPTNTEITEVAWATCRRTMALLKKRGQWFEDDPADVDRLAQDDPLLAQCYAASISGTLLLGPNKGQRVLRFKGVAARENNTRAPLAAYGFDVDAAVRVPAHDRARLERLARYIARPPIANERLEQLADGRFRLRLKTFWSDGTTHLIFDGPELLARLVALIPPPRAHQIRFFGVFAPNSKVRGQIVPEASAAACEHDSSAREPPERRTARQRLAWSRLMERVFKLDVLKCPRCGQEGMQLIASIMMPETIQAILKSAATGPPLRELVAPAG